MELKALSYNVHKPIGAFRFFEKTLVICGGQPPIKVCNLESETCQRIQGFASGAGCVIYFENNNFVFRVEGTRAIQLKSETTACAKLASTVEFLRFQDLS